MKTGVQRAVAEALLRTAGTVLQANPPEAPEHPLTCALSHQVPAPPLADVPTWP